MDVLSSFTRLLADPIEVLLDALPTLIQQTVRDFRAEYSDWEVEVQDLFGDIDEFLAEEVATGAAPISPSVAEDVAGLKGLVEQQTEVLSALVNALTGSSEGEEVVSESENACPDELHNQIDPFERLQQAVAAASESS